MAAVYVLVRKATGRPVGGTVVPTPGRTQAQAAPPTWRTEARRVLLCAVWFLVIWFVARVAAGAVVGGITGGQIGAHAAPGTDQRAAILAASQAAAVQFLGRYGLLLLLGSLAASVAGTAAGVLPGTRRPAAAPPAAGVPPEGQWPPPPAP